MYPTPLNSTRRQNVVAEFTEDLFRLSDEGSRKRFASWLDLQLETLEDRFGTYSTSSSIMKSITGSHGRN